MGHELNGREVKAFVRLHELGCFERGDSLLTYVTDEGEHLTPVSWGLGDERTAVDVAGTIEGALHTILDAGGTDDDVRLILGLEEGDPDADEGLVAIDLGYCLRGPLWSAEVADEVTIGGLSVDPVTLTVLAGGEPLLVRKGDGPVSVYDECDGVERNLGISFDGYDPALDRLDLVLSAIDDDGYPLYPWDDLTVEVPLTVGTLLRQDDRWQADALATLEGAGLAERLGSVPYGCFGSTAVEVSLGAREHHDISQG